MDEVRFAVAGCGAVSRAHIESIVKIKDARLVAVASRSEERARKTAERWGCDWTTDYEELVKRDDIDIVNICTPSGYHADVALPAIEAGKHVLIEKPIEVTIERANRIINAARKKGVKVGVIFQSRSAPANQELKRIINSGSLGRLVLADAYVKWFRSQEYYDQAEWRGTKKFDGGGSLMNQSIHQIDLLQWFMGPVRSVKAYTDTLAHDNIEVEDTAVAVLRFANGALGVIEGTTSINPGYPKEIQVHGDKGSVVLADDRIKEWNVPGYSEDKLNVLRSREAENSNASSDPMAISFINHQRQIEDMISAIKKDREPLVNGEEGRKSVEIILAIYESARTGKEVKFR